MSKEAPKVTIGVIHTESGREVQIVVKESVMARLEELRAMSNVKIGRE